MKIVLELKKGTTREGAQQIAEEVYSELGDDYPEILSVEVKK